MLSSQILFGPFLNTLTHMLLNIFPLTVHSITDIAVSLHGLQAGSMCCAFGATLWLIKRTDNV